ncbi:type VII toxin-antitoxin system HepT family RNase toxin [Caminibacter pacificus]
MDDVIINKCDSILRCLRRIEEDYDEDFNKNYTKQDAVILNIQRAVQQAIDLGAYIVKKKRLGIPKSSKEIFEIMENEGFIDKRLSENLQKMVGFRNLAIHEYTKLKLEILKYIIEERIWDLKEFVDEIKSYD